MKTEIYLDGKLSAILDSVPVIPVGSVVMVWNEYGKMPDGETETFVCKVTKSMIDLRKLVQCLHVVKEP